MKLELKPGVIFPNKEDIDTLTTQAGYTVIQDIQKENIENIFRQCISMGMIVNMKNQFTWIAINSIHQIKKIFDSKVSIITCYQKQLSNTYLTQQDAEEDLKKAGKSEIKRHQATLKIKNGEFIFSVVKMGNLFCITKTNNINTSLSEWLGF